MDAARHDFSQSLRRVGLRVTVPRLAVLAAMADGPAHADAETIAAVIRARIGDVPRQTVYNVLRAFVQAGLVRRIEPAGSPGLYELRVGDNHHHVVCRRCGATADLDCASRRAPCLEPEQTRGFLIDEAEVTFWGLCPECRGLASGKSGDAMGRPGNGDE